MQTQEQRLTSRLLKYWDTVRKTHALPEIEHFNQDPIEDLWRQCFLVAIDTHGATTYKYEYIGDAITAAYGRDLTGENVDGTVKKFPGVIMYQKFGEIVAEHRPKEDSGYFLSEKG